MSIEHILGYIFWLWSDAINSRGQSGHLVLLCVTFRPLHIWWLQGYDAHGSRRAVAALWRSWKTISVEMLRRISCGRLLRDLSEDRHSESARLGIIQRGNKTRTIRPNSKQEFLLLLLLLIGLKAVFRRRIRVFSGFGWFALTRAFETDGVNSGAVFYLYPIGRCYQDRLCVNIHNCLACEIDPQGTSFVCFVFSLP